MFLILLFVMCSFPVIAIVIVLVIGSWFVVLWSCYCSCPLLCLLVLNALLLFVLFVIVIVIVVVLCSNY